MAEAARIGGYVGVGAGLALYALFGLLPTTFLGGLAGINLAGLLFGDPVRSGLLPRLLVGGAMLLSLAGGIAVSSTLGIAAGRTTGRLLGAFFEALRRQIPDGDPPARQRAPRRPASGIVDFLRSDHSILPGMKRNVSEGGMGVTFLTGNGIRSGDVLLMDDGTPRGRRLRIVWTRASENGTDAGLAYLDLHSD